MKQQTLKHTFTLSGTGLHSGAASQVTVYPAPPGTGYVLRLGGRDHPITPSLCDGRRHCDTVTTPDGAVMQVEHLLAALWGMQIDNAVIEPMGGEIPGMDGSAASFIQLIETIGLDEQEAEAIVLRPKAPVAVGGPQAGVTAYPADDGMLTITYILDYPQSPHARGMATYEINPEAVASHLAPARTFVMKEHIDAVRAAGLGKGATAKNTVVLDGERVVDNKLRFPDECVRHKILDLLGDLATMGTRLAARVVACRSGHDLNLELARGLVQSRLQPSPAIAPVLDTSAIEKILPHRYPFFLVDRVLELEPGRRAVSIKNVTRNEDFFNGHFPGQPIMPGVLQIEALAQTGGIVLLGTCEKNQLAVLTGVDEVKFRRQVVPGDQIRMEVEIIRQKGRIGIAKARSTVDGETAAECVIKFAMVDRAND